MISLSGSNSLLNYLTAQTSQNAGSMGSSTASATGSTNANTKVPTVTQAAAGRHDASVAGRALDKQQTALAGDLRAAMSKAGVKLSGAVEFSVSSWHREYQGQRCRQSRDDAFLKADTSKPGFCRTHFHAGARRPQALGDHSA